MPQVTGFSGEWPLIPWEGEHPATSGSTGARQTREGKKFKKGKKFIAKGARVAVGGKGGGREFEELVSYAYGMQTPCEKYPERCQPREIKTVVLDADGVLWDLAGIASNIEPPFRLENETTLYGSRPSFGGYISYAGTEEGARRWWPEEPRWWEKERQERERELEEEEGKPTWHWDELFGEWAEFKPTTYKKVEDVRTGREVVVQLENMGWGYLAIKKVLEDGSAEKIYYNLPHSEIAKALEALEAIFATYPGVKDKSGLPQPGEQKEEKETRWYWDEKLERWKRGVSPLLAIEKPKTGREVVIRLINKGWDYYTIMNYIESGAVKLDYKLSDAEVDKAWDALDEIFMQLPKEAEAAAFALLPPGPEPEPELPPETKLLPPGPAKGEEKPKTKEFGIKITLRPGVREELDKLKAEGIPVSVISLNTPGSVERIIKEFGLRDRFVEVRDTWGNKGKVFKELVISQKISPCSALFVDDTIHNVEDVADQCALSLHMGRDIKQIGEIRKYMKVCK